MPTSRTTTDEERRGGTHHLPSGIGRNVFGTYGSTVILGLTTLLVTPTLLHRLGAAGFGVWSLVTGITVFLGLLSLGLGSVTTKLVAEDAGRDEDALLRVCCTSFFALSAMAVIALALGIALGVAAPYLLDIPARFHHDSQVAFGLVASGMAITIPGSVFYGILCGFQRYDLAAWCTAFTTVAVGVASVIVVTSGGDLVDLAVADAVVNVLTLVLPVTLARRFVPGFRLSFRLVDRRAIRRTASLSIWYMVQSVATVIGEDIDLLVVGALINVEGVAAYAIGAKLSQLASKLVVPVQQVFFPHVSALSANGRSRSQLQGVLIDGTRTVMAVALPISAVLIILARLGVQAWVGRGYPVAVDVVMIFGTAAAVSSLTSVCWELAGGLGRARFTALLGAADALVNLVVSVMLAHPLGPAGVALGTLLSLTFVSTPIMLAAAMHLVGLPFGRWVRQTVVPHLLPLAVTVGALYPLSAVLPASAPVVVAAGAAAFVVYGALYLAVGATPVERERILDGLQSVSRRLRRAPGESHQGDTGHRAPSPAPVPAPVPVPVQDQPPQG